jgi:hypothetical protein
MTRFFFIFRPSTLDDLLLTGTKGSLLIQREQIQLNQKEKVVISGRRLQLGTDQGCQILLAPHTKTAKIFQTNTKHTK